MTRFAIDRKNRDRQGGHTPSGLGGYGRTSFPSPGVRKDFKRMGVKLLRRQHSQAISEGIALMEQEQEDRIAAFWGIQEDLDYDASENLRRKQEREDDYYSPFDFDDGIDCGDSECRQCYPRDRFDIHRARSDAFFQTQSAAALSDGEVAFKIIEGEIDIDEEFVSKRDDGKSLGQLLRERLSRPF